MVPSFATQSSVAVDVEARCHHLDATDLGAELGIKICGAKLSAIGLGMYILAFEIDK